MLKKPLLHIAVVAAVVAIGLALDGAVAFADSSTATPTVTATIDTSAKTNMFVAVSPDGTTGLVTDYQGSGRAYLINLVTHTVIGPVPGISSSVAATFSPDGKSVYVSQDSLDQILKIDVATGTITNTLTLPPFSGGSNVWKIVLSPDGKTGYATAYHSSPPTLFVFDPVTMTNLRSVTLAADPHGASLSPDGSKLYVAGSTAVQVLSTSTFATLATIPVPGGGPLLETGISASGAVLAVTSLGASTVSVIDTATNTLTGTYPTPSAFGVAVAPDGKTVYVTNYQNNSVSVLNSTTGAVRTTVALPAGATPSGIVTSADGQYEYVSNQGNGTVTVLTNFDRPAVTTNPASATVPAGSRHTFSAAATGVLTPTVQWQVSSDGGKTWANIAGATAPSFTTGALTMSDSGNQYRAVFTNASGSATTLPATITVTTVATTPLPTTTPATPVTIPTAVDAGRATLRVATAAPLLGLLGAALLILGAGGAVAASRRGRQN